MLISKFNFYFFYKNKKDKKEKIKNNKGQANII